MADDITLTVRVRDLARGDFDRLHGRLERMKRDLQGVNRSTDSAGMHSKRLGQDIEGLSNKFKRMQETGSLTRRELTQMRGTLDGMSRSALNAARSGEINSQSYHNMNNEIGRLRAELNRFDAGLNNNTNTINRNNNSHRTTVRLVNGVVRSVQTMTRSVHGNTNVINTWRRDAGRVAGTVNTLGNNSSFAGKAFGNMHAKLIGTATVLIASLLPTIGALGPMIAGLGSIVGVAALAFMGLDKPTKMLSKDQKEFLKGLKPLKSAFADWQTTARKAVLPGLTKSFGDIKKAMKSLNPVLTIAGGAFSTLVDKIAKGVSSKDFMGPFLKNVKMGTKWVLQFAGSIGKFTTSLFDFGTKSQKALDAWQNLLGGFLDRGLPNMFKSMESGISGSSDFLNGLATFINDSLLPGLGKLLAAFMRTFGPLLEQLLIGAGNVFTGFASIFDGSMKGIAPIVSMVTDAFRAFNAVAKIGAEVFGDLASVLGDALFGTLQDLGIIKTNPFSDLTNSFKAFSNWVKENSVQIRSSFTLLADSIIGMVQVGVNSLPMLMNGFRLLAEIILESIGAMVSGLATAFSHVPILGGLFKDAKTRFDKFKGEWEGTLDDMATQTSAFATAASSRLSQAKLTLDVSTAKRNLKDIIEKLKDPHLTATQRAHLEVDKTNAEGNLARAEEALQAFRMKKYSATIGANNAPFFGSKAQADNARMKSHSAAIRATTSGFWAGIRSIPLNVGTRYITVQMRRVESQNAPRFSANGNVFRHFAEGGMENHQAQIASGGTTRIWNEPETGGEAYIPLSPSKRTRSRQIAAQTVGILGGTAKFFAHGGVTKSERDARHSATGELTVSRFGIFAGSKNSENISALTKSDTLQPVIDQLNHLRTTIKKTTHGITESRLLKKLDSAGKSLLSNQKKLESVNKQLDDAKTKLSDLKQAAAQLKESVTNAVISDTDITKSASAEDSQVTINTLLSQMTANSGQAKEFSSLLTTLKGRGLSKDLISQVAQAGLNGGGLETARALAGANSGQIKTLNSLQSSIATSASSAGKTASDAMYAAGIKAADGLVKGLTSKQKAIEKAMLSIAKSMEKSIKSALGIHSPSRVMMDIGHHTAEGFALGMQRNARVNSAWESMLNVSNTRASGPQYVGHPMTVQVMVGGKNIGEVIIDPLRKAVRHRGGDVQVVLGK